MTTTGNSTERGSWAQSGLTFALMIAVVMFTPIFRAGATPTAALVSQFLAIALIASALWSPSALVIRRFEAVLLLLLVLLPALYLIPLPKGIVEELAGRDLYLDALALLPASTQQLTATLAVYSGASSAAVLSLLLPVGVFLGVRRLEPRRMEQLIGAVIVIAALQALLGLLQYGTAQTGGLPLTVEGAHLASAVGTYVNRNHLAGLLEMVLPVVLALFFFALTTLEGPHHRSRSLKRKAIALGSRSGHAVILWAALALLLIIGAVFTRSRTGLLLVMLGVVLSAVVFARMGGRRGGAVGPTGLIVMLAVMAALGLGLTPVLDRFSLTGIESDARWQLFIDARLAGLDLFPIGAGPGGFPFAFPASQSQELGWAFVNRAHNDYLEWFYNLGIGAVFLLCLTGFVYVLQWPRVFAESKQGRLNYIQVGSGIGVLVLALHETVDYNLHTPANQVVFALLLSVYLYPADRLPESRPRKSRRRSTPDLVPAPEPKHLSSEPPPDQIDNPFLKP